jgi:hypothetical protein
MTDMPTNSRMPVWGVLVIVGSALAVGVIAFLVILNFLSLAGGPQAGLGQPAVDGPGTGQQGSESPAAEEPASGATYTSDEFGYEVTFPGEAMESSVTQSVAGFDLEIVTASWTAGGRNVSTNATVFPDELFVADATDEMLQGSVEGAASSVGGTLEDVEFVDIEGERAISGVIRASGADIYMVVFFHDQTQYSIASVNGTQAEHDEIVASFRLLD